MPRWAHADRGRYNIARMSEQQLEIDDKIYIPSGRAASLVGYTKDYVGQLARAGKVDSRLIGRSWYISEDSIRKHKLSVHYTLTKSKKSRRVEADDEHGRGENISENKVSSASRENYQQHVPTLRADTLPSRERVADGLRAHRTAVGREDKQEVHSHSGGASALVHADVVYEPGVRLYFDDEEAPALPQVRKGLASTEEPAQHASQQAGGDGEVIQMRAVAATPTVPRMPQHEVRTQCMDAGVVRARRRTALSTADMTADGIRVNVVPQARQRALHVAAPLPQVMPHHASERHEAPVSRVHRTKKYPVLAGLLVLALYLVWYLVH